MKIKYVISNDLRSKGFNELIESNFPQFLTEEDPELILVSGGDGAMLHAIQQYKDLRVPFLGKAQGTLNFLMNTWEDDVAVLTKLLQNETGLHFYTTHAIGITHKNSKGDECYITEAVNDIVIGNGIMDYHHFRLNTDDGSLKDFLISGTGICLSTPLGSTAYNFNNNGKILPLDSNLWSMTGIVCNKYLDDLLLVQDITIEILSERQHPILFIDGIVNNIKLSPGDLLRLQNSQPIKLAFIDKQVFAQKRIDMAHRLRKE